MYYKPTKDGNYVEVYTYDKALAKRYGCTLETEEDAVLQGDGSGYVLQSKYIAPPDKPSTDEQIATLAEQVESLSTVLDYLLMEGGEL